MVVSENKQNVGGLGLLGLASGDDQSQPAEQRKPQDNGDDT